MKNYLYFMRLSAAILVALHLSAAGNCQTLLNENFSYPSGSSLTANGWNAHSSPGVNAVVVSSQGLAFLGYPSSDIGLSALLANTGEDVNKSFSPVTTGVMYFSFLVKVNAITNDYFFNLGGTTMSTTTYRGKVFTDGTGNNFNFGLSLGSNTPVLTTGEPYVKGSVYLVVLKYSFIPDLLNDQVSLFVFSGTMPGAEPVTPTIGPLIDANVADVNNIGTLALRQYSAAQNILIDGIRAATKWTDAVGVLTGKEDPSIADDPVLYPVPVKDELIVSNILNVTMIEIFDLTGRKIISIKTESTDIVRIPMYNLSQGLYLIRLNTSDGIKIMRFVKS